MLESDRLGSPLLSITGFTSLTVSFNGSVDVEDADGYKLITSRSEVAGFEARLGPDDGRANTRTSVHLNAFNDERCLRRHGHGSEDKNDDEE